MTMFRFSGGVCISLYFSSCNNKQLNQSFPIMHIAAEYISQPRPAAVHIIIGRNTAAQRFHKSIFDIDIPYLVE